MLTRLQIRNFKRLDLDVDLRKDGAPVSDILFVGPNNSGKTTALQALTLWELGLRVWHEKRGMVSGLRRPGTVISRRDLLSVPVPSTELLWHNLRVRSAKATDAGRKGTQNIRIDVIVDGYSAGKAWSCGLEFDHTNNESLTCRPIRIADDQSKPVQSARFTEIPNEALALRLAYLPPMSGLAANEPKWELGRMNVLLGEGQTAQILRNLCLRVYQQGPDRHTWQALRGHMAKHFGVDLQPPRFVAERGEVTMSYVDLTSKVVFDLSAAGRGLQQTLLLLSFLYTNPQSILLLDEPDAHLEVLRQRELYRLLSETARSQGSQIIAASQSEVVLNEAAQTGQVIVFLGRPHPLSKRSSQVHKALSQIGFSDYLQAEQSGWVLYVEGAIDLAILRAFAALGSV